MHISCVFVKFTVALHLFSLPLFLLYLGSEDAITVGDQGLLLAAGVAPHVADVCFCHPPMQCLVAPAFFCVKLTIYWGLNRIIYIKQI